MSDRKSLVWRLLGGFMALVGIASLLFTLINTFVLNKKVGDLENQATVLGLANSFWLEQPHSSELQSVPVKQETLFGGPFAGSMPETHEAWAVLEAGGEYYIERPQLRIYKFQRRWEQRITPWPGKWRLHICVAAGEGEALLEAWADERTPEGKIDYNNARDHLPDGVLIVATFEFTAVEASVE